MWLVDVMMLFYARILLETRHLSHLRYGDIIDGTGAADVSLIGRYPAFTTVNTGTVNAGATFSTSKISAGGATKFIVGVCDLNGPGNNHDIRAISMMNLGSSDRNVSIAVKASVLTDDAFSAEVLGTHVIASVKNTSAVSDIYNIGYMLTGEAGIKI